MAKAIKISFLGNAQPKGQIIFVFIFMKITIEAKVEKVSGYLIRGGSGF